MTYQFEAFGFPVTAFADGALIHAAEFSELSDLREEVFQAFYLPSVCYIMITHNGERRMVTACAQFDAEYMENAPHEAGN